VKFQDFVGTNARDGEELQDAFRYFLTQLLQAWMRSGLVKFGDDVCDGIADARNVGECARCDNAIERL